MERTDVLVIGGGAAGVVAAVVGKSTYPEKTFVLLRREKQALIPCGIPYIFGSLENSNKDLMSDEALSKSGVDLKIGEALSFDTQNKICKLADGSEIGFEKLVLALGSIPVNPKWLKRTDLENVFFVRKSKEYLDDMISRLEALRKIVIVGGGFIGVEVADEIRKKGKEVTLVEVLPHLLALAFDQEICARVEEVLSSRGVRIITNNGIKEIWGEEKVAGITLSNGEKMEADAVILAMGYQPNTEIARDSGIELNSNGSIKVDCYMRTSHRDIFAVGDCAEKRDFFTRKLTNTMLASVATSEARIAGMNLYALSAVKAFCGTISIFSTSLGEVAFGVAGLTEFAAKEEGFNVVTGVFEGVDRHPGTLPGAQKQMVKLIVARESGIVLGGEVVGGTSAGELINLIGFIVQSKMTVNNVLTSQFGTHPLLTAAPTVYPLAKAAENVAKKL
jgi:NADPH-dependent 2,4-dienoyl-CoA reductase/sulfur reductase-like enzyme